MKKLLFTAAIAVLGFTNVNAQDEVSNFGFGEGNVIIEGNLGFNSNTETDSDNTGDLGEDKFSNFNFNPKVGYFISDDLAIGVELALGSNNIERTNFGTPNTVTETKGNTFAGGVFARYYFLELGERFKTYGEFGVGFASSKSEVSQTGATTLLQDNETSGFGAGVSLGINYFVSESFAINFGLSDVLAFNSTTETDNLNTNDAETKESGFSGNLNAFNNFFRTAQFGLTFKF